MIKTITERTLHEVLVKMRSEGVTLKDTEGFGINIDQSGHVYVVYMGEETETGVIDTSAGESGVSAWINPGNSNPTSYIEIGEIKTAVAYGAESLSNTSGTTWEATLAGASANSNIDYIKPRTVTIQATGNAPELVDDGLGNIILNDLDRRKMGSINYETGAISVTYFTKKAPVSAPSVAYHHSPLPNSSVFPKVVALSHIVFVTSSNNGHIQYELYNNLPTATSPYQAPCFFNHGNSLTPANIGGTDYMAEDFCDSRISICLNTAISDRTSRWMKVSANSNDVVKAVYVYWNRLST